MSFNGYSTFCFHSLVDGYLGGFHVFAIIIMLLWICIYLYLSTFPLQFFWIYLWEELLGHTETLCLNFEDVSHSFQKQVHHFTFPPSMSEGSNFSTSSPILLLSCFFIVFILVGVNRALTYSTDRKFQYLYKNV